MKGPAVEVRVTVAGELCTIELDFGDPLTMTPAVELDVVELGQLCDELWAALVSMRGARALRGDGAYVVKPERRATDAIAAADRAAREAPAEPDGADNDAGSLY
jgi:hypothetical protein